MSEYLVEGYGAAARNPNYDGPYLDGHDFDPAVNYMFAGDPEKQAELQQVIADTEGTPVLSDGGVKIITPDGEKNVVILGKEPDDVETVVLQKTTKDEMDEETAKADLESTVNPEGAGAPSGTVDTEQDASAKDKVDLDGPSGADEQREGRPYNPTQEVRLSDHDEEGEKENPSADQKTQAVTNDPQTSSGITLS